MSPEITIPPEVIDAMMRETFGVSAEEFEKLSIEQRAQLAFDRGLAFAGNVPVTKPDGTTITEQEQKVFRPKFGKDDA